LTKQKKNEERKKKWFFDHLPGKQRLGVETFRHSFHTIYNSPHCIGCEDLKPNIWRLSLITSVGRFFF
jgi:hypothetical protein